MTNQTIDIILKRLLADVDDSMEFIDTIFNSKDNASHKVSMALERANIAINKEIEQERALLLSDLARAVGLLEGLGYPDKYLSDRLTQALKGREGESDACS